MMTTEFLENPAYCDSCRFILEGHVKLARGESSLPETDADHDRMTEAWFDLSPAEKARLKGLSADLHLLRDKEVVLKLDSAEGAIEHHEKLLADAVKKKDWEGALTLLRYGPPWLKRDHIALLRGQAWQALGHDEVALLFFDYAGRAKPGNFRAQFLSLQPLVKLRRFKEVMRRSEDYLVAENANPFSENSFAASPMM